MSNALTTGERARINTYLAVKYGVTMASGFSYLDTTGNVIWSGNVNSGYSNNITAIGRDDAEGLNQKQSKTQNISGLVTIALGATAATNNANTNTFLNDKSYLIFGDDRVLNSISS